MINSNRRQFIKFFGRTGAMAVGISALPGCVLNTDEKTANQIGKLPFTPIDPIDSDNLVLPSGFNYHVIAKQGDAITDTQTFGDHNDYTAFYPLDDSGNDGLLWVNHENVSSLLVSGYQGSRSGVEKTLEQVNLEMEAVGGSIIRVRKNSQGKWEMIKNDPYNRRIHGLTPIPFNWDEPILGKTEAIGTLANCAGGITPWGSVLTCEENYHNFWGERNFETGESSGSPKRWDKYYDHPPEHYGWVVEVDFKTGEASKLVALGRCAHEAAPVHQEKNGICVVYTGDDKENECLYKFIGNEPNSLKKGTLYVANTEKGQWISMDINEQPALKENFKDQTEVLIRLREAAKLVGGTPLDRPEDIEFDPITGNVFMTLTNNKGKGNYHGSILKIIEKDGNKLAMEFTTETFIVGGEEMGFSCPDNIAFDKKGNLWVCCDIGGGELNKPPYEKFKNNGLYFIPMSGPMAGMVFQVGSAPVAVELTGLTFSPDFKTLFLSVQHPGETSRSLDELTSHWPDGGDSLPRSSVVAIHGEALDKLMG
ncbi:MAG: DUF839 domain-containing protein [Bacteroidetes bacterium]|nr:DUF839 domain-containing protein [Bacteroidota bacterium]MDA1120052.1 DUF839 domain-containing protein [Bacteroidota bacterium]